ncbi:DUF262 domain-containing protein [Idiomarina abyssalis]|uniref:DUF262 domain-containing protein n=1 Tax=Idiomarina abyssalis TaxID=86102 RepID=UPI0022FFE2B0|nr:DUF262 domain-containing protein [Idiomarina abyssalis]MDA6066804.1 DUF262 domain-containing protein [Idiomarina abyssalis]
MQRRPTTQDISWFLDLNDNGKINLTPPYQRRSVWTRKDRVYFLDTIFKGYPCPAVFLHKTTDHRGKATYHVVDGKQRLETIFSFASNKMSMPKDFSDSELAGKRFQALDPELKQRFWDYVIAVDMLDIIEQAVVDEVFDRLNRNSRKLERQELRHAKYDGWFINFAESQSEDEEWKTLGIATASRARRMKDVQFISELLVFSIKGEVQGFSQDNIDDFYAHYDEPNEEEPDFRVEDFEANFIKVRDYIVAMEQANNCVSEHARNYMHFYTLWNVVFDMYEEQTPDQLANKYSKFMEQYKKIPREDAADATDLNDASPSLKYAANSIGANTELPQRAARFEALSESLK